MKYREYLLEKGLTQEELDSGMFDVAIADAQKFAYLSVVEELEDIGAALALVNRVQVENKGYTHVIDLIKRRVDDIKNKPIWKQSEIN